jgi:hypothetical protein
MSTSPYTTSSPVAVALINGVFVIALAVQRDLLLLPQPDVVCHAIPPMLHHSSSPYHPPRVRLEPDNQAKWCDLLLLNSTYAYTPHTLVRPLSTAVEDIDNVDERCPAGQDELEGGGARCPPTAAAIILVAVVVVDGGSVGANDQLPLPLAPNGWPADDVKSWIPSHHQLPCATPSHPPRLCICHCICCRSCTTPFPPQEGGGGNKVTCSGLLAGSSGSWIVVACTLVARESERWGGRG